MPKVRGKKFAYTKEGIAAAKRYAVKYKKGGNTQVIKIGDVM